MKQLIADPSLTYVHTASDGKQTIVMSDGLNRWHLIEGSERTMALPSTPTDIAGRYALDFYDLSTRRGYRRFHDDYMLPTPLVHRSRDWNPRKLGPRTQYQRAAQAVRERYFAGVFNGKPLPKFNDLILGEISDLIDGDPWRQRGCF